MGPTVTPPPLNFQFASRDLVLSNGNNNDIDPQGANYLRVTGPSAAFSINGFSGGLPGMPLFVEIAVAQTVTITNQSANSAAANRIVTQSGADVVLIGPAAIEFQYDATQSRWIPMALWDSTGKSVALSNVTGNLGATQSTGSAGVWIDGPSVSLAAGMWLLIGVAEVRSDGGGGIVVAKLWDGTTVFDAGEVTVETPNYVDTLTLTAIVSPTTTTTYKITAAINSGGFSIMAATTILGVGITPVSKIVAVKIG